MEHLSEKRFFYGNNMMIIRQDETCTVYKMKDDTGEGIMTRYSVFPGIDLMYNDFHMKSCLSEFKPNVEMIGIDHCRAGRIEWEFQDGSYRYIGAGDMQINTRETHVIRHGFPLGHYQGITVGIYTQETAEILASIFEGITVDLQGLRQKFCSGNKQFVMRAKDSIQHIFSELYTVPDQIRKNYFKIKVLELLLFLSAIDVPEQGEERPYFSKKQVDTIKGIMQYIVQNMDRHFTLDELSSKFEISLTTMKLCFRGVYGTSIYAYIRAYRMQAAALMLRESNENIATIAAQVGYENASKFAAAFREIMSTSPSKYRK